MKCPHGCCDIQHLRKQKRIDRKKAGKHPNVWRYDGIEYTARELSAVMGLPKSVIYDRLKHGYCIKQAHCPKPGSGKRREVSMGDTSVAQQFAALRW